MGRAKGFCSSFYHHLFSHIEVYYYTIFYYKSRRPPNRLDSVCENEKNHRWSQIFYLTSPVQVVLGTSTELMCLTHPPEKIDIESMELSGDTKEEQRLMRKKKLRSMMLDIPVNGTVSTNPMKKSYTDSIVCAVDIIPTVEYAKSIAPVVSIDEYVSVIETKIAREDSSSSTVDCIDGIESRWRCFRVHGSNRYYYSSYYRDCL
jgi:hypothetical protein